MAVSPFKARYDALTLEERLARAYETMDTILALGQSVNTRGNLLQRARIEALQKNIDWLEAKIAARNGPTYNLATFTRCR